jgi:hypothetical protein
VKRGVSGVLGSVPGMGGWGDLWRGSKGSVTDGRSDLIRGRDFDAPNGKMLGFVRP